jgi:hypothetical protein
LTNCGDAVIERQVKHAVNMALLLATKQTTDRISDINALSDEPIDINIPDIWPVAVDYSQFAKKDEGLKIDLEKAWKLSQDTGDTPYNEPTDQLIANAELLWGLLPSTDLDSIIAAQLIFSIVASCLMIMILAKIAKINAVLATITCHITIASKPADALSDNLVCKDAISQWQDIMHTIFLIILTIVLILCATFKIIQIIHNTEIGQAALTIYKGWTDSDLAQVQLRLSAPNHNNYLYIPVKKTVFNPAYMTVSNEHDTIVKPTKMTRTCVYMYLEVDWPGISFLHHENQKVIPVILKNVLRLPLGQANRCRKMLEGIHFADLVIAKQGVYHTIARKSVHEDVPNYPPPPPESNIAMEVIPFQEARMPTPLAVARPTRAKYNIQSGKIKLTCLDRKSVV